MPSPASRPRPHRPIEIVIVDDGSTDETPEVIASLGPAVRGVRQENQGPVVARNHGISLARGDFVGFLDSDDLWAAGKTAAQLARFAARPELDAVLSHMRNFSGDGPDDEGEVSISGLPGMLIRRALFDRVGQLDPTLAYRDGSEWLIRATEAGAVMETMPDILMYRRLHDANISGEDPRGGGRRDASSRPRGGGAAAAGRRRLSHGAGGDSGDPPGALGDPPGPDIEPSSSRLPATRSRGRLGLGKLAAGRRRREGAFRGGWSVAQGIAAAPPRQSA